MQDSIFYVKSRDKKLVAAKYLYNNEVPVLDSNSTIAKKTDIYDASGNLLPVQNVLGYLIVPSDYSLQKAISFGNSISVETAIADLGDYPLLDEFGTKRLSWQVQATALFLMLIVWIFAVHPQESFASSIIGTAKCCSSYIPAGNIAVFHPTHRINNLVTCYNKRFVSFVCSNERYIKGDRTGFTTGDSGVKSDEIVVTTLIRTLHREAFLGSPKSQVNSFDVSDRIADVYNIELSKKTVTGGRVVNPGIPPAVCARLFDIDVSYPNARSVGGVKFIASQSDLLGRKVSLSNCNGNKDSGEQSQILRISGDGLVRGCLYAFGAGLFFGLTYFLVLLDYIKK